MKLLLKSILIFAFIAIFIGFILYIFRREEYSEPTEEEEIKGETVKLTASIRVQQVSFTVYPEKRHPLTGNWATILDFYIRDQSSGTLYYQTTTATNASGTGTIVFTPSDNIPNVTYRIYIKGFSHLTKRYDNIAFNQQFETLDLTSYEDLKAGDTHISSDDLINSLDVSTIVTALASGSNKSDLNQDSLVNSLDVSNLVFNFGESGDV